MPPIAAIESPSPTTTPTRVGKPLRRRGVDVAQHPDEHYGPPRVGNRLAQVEEPAPLLAHPRWPSQAIGEIGAPLPRSALGARTGTVMASSIAAHDEVTPPELDDGVAETSLLWGPVPMGLTASTAYR